MTTKTFQAAHGIIPDYHVSTARFIGLVLTAYLYWFLSLGLGFTGHFIYFIYSRTKTLLTDPATAITSAYHAIKPIHFKPLTQVTDEGAPLGSINHPYRVIVVGAGYSGVGLAIKLKEAGCKDFVVFERDISIGGTWYANKYPGIACDVPSTLYSFSFRQNPNWSHKFGRGPEIHQYMEDVVDEYGIREMIKFKSEVSEMRWNEDKGLWKITLKNNSSYYTRVICNGQGPLSDPAIPKDIPGVDTFKGPAFHSGYWDQSVKLDGKRVAIIGSGASSVQVVPSIVDKVEKLVLFQRTPGWVTPREDFKIPAFVKTVFKVAPIVQSFVRACQYHGREGMLVAFQFPWSPVQWLFSSIGYAFLYFSVPDPELRRKLTPNFSIGCKRVMVSDDWYTSLQKPNVYVETDRIDRVEQDGVVTKSGTKHKVDVIVFCTGYQIQRADHHLMPIYGRDGVQLSEVWSNGMYGYKSTTLQGFPNFFFLLGPNCGLGHNSMIVMIESTLNYVIDAIKTMEEQKIAVWDVKSQAVTKYNQNLQKHLKNTVWNVGGCTSWYRDREGRNTTVWPTFTWVFRYVMRRFDVENYNVTKY